MRGVSAAIGFIVLAGCGEAALKPAGAECVASAECTPGLLCDLGQSPAVCASIGSERPPDDAAASDAAIDADVPLDAGVVSDAEPIDAAPIDAAIDAML